MSKQVGYRKVVCYFCEEENKYIFEDLDEMNLPTSCKNNTSHKIKEGSLFICNKYVNAKPLKCEKTFDEIDFSVTINNSNVNQKLKELSTRVKLLEDILEKNKLINFIN